MSTQSRPVARRLLFGAMIAWIAGVTPVLAQDGPAAHATASTEIAARYPSGSIQSIETADRALKEVEEERTGVEARFAEDERVCYAKFFVNSCREAARERRRVALTRIRPVEVEANAFKRRARVEERDKALAEKRTAAEQETAERQQKQQQSVPREPKSAEHAPGDRKPSDTSDRQAQHEARLERLRVEDAANAQKRADNIAAYEKKVREAEAHQREVEERKLEKEKEREKK